MAVSVSAPITEQPDDSTPTPPLVANLDHYGSLWGFSTVEDAARETAQEAAEGATVEEWETVDRDGQPLHVARVTHPKFGIDIRVTSTWATASKAVAR